MIALGFIPQGGAGRTVQSTQWLLACFAHSDFVQDIKSKTLRQPSLARARRPLQHQIFL
jgi:hypothetical protein